MNSTDQKPVFIEWFTKKLLHITGGEMSMNGEINCLYFLKDAVVTYNSNNYSNIKTAPVDASTKSE